MGCDANFVMGWILDSRVVASFEAIRSRLGWCTLLAVFPGRLRGSLDDGPHMALLLGRNICNNNRVVGFGHSNLANQR